MRFGRYKCGLLCLLGCATAACAEPLPVRDLNPFLSGYEIPPALPAAPPEKIALLNGLAVSNISLHHHNAHESVQLDGELQRLQFGLALPVGDTLGIRLELPLVRATGGHLDNFIESFHRTFNLPNGNRGSWPKNRLWIRHSREGVQDFLQADAHGGIGDITMRIGKRLGDSVDYLNTLWVSLKLPTGDGDKLTGSGSVDMAVSLAAAQRLGSRFTAQQQVSLSVLGHGERLPTQQKSAVWSGSLGMEASISSRWSAIVQVDGHTQVFVTGLRSLGPALQLQIGPRYRSGTWRSEFILSEDLATDTGPDVQFQLDISRAY